MINVAIDGPAGAGKSTVAKLIKDDGYFHIDADVLAKEIIDRRN